ncbi:uncharacterized protein LOC114324936 [Diabrotica virgifera virgifera]|uniref:Uncharacterized protein LOC114324936 n=2 Tax=Diabrotica virgifera virgifera TaxID=50390 RepID=A0A6P7F4A4_DIAVI|nr:uncharacterized protein LOC114324936 [Diabrotica virgifera virgifera]
MGMPNSKFGKEIPKEDLHEGSVPSTPILTPKTIVETELDPRSPSLHIARTPLEVLCAVAEKLNCENETPIRNKNIIQEIDPRSPTTDFRRTPIVLESCYDSTKKLYNKHLNKVRLSEMTQTTPNPAINKKSAIPPKLLESSPIQRKVEAYKRRSLVGLLETNVDFTETDLDKILQDKCKVEENPQNNGMDENINEVCNGKSEDKLPVDNEDDGLQQLSLNEIGNNNEGTIVISDENETKKDVENDGKHNNAVDTDNKCEEEIVYEEHVFERTKMHILRSPKSAPCSPVKVSKLKEIKSQPLTPHIDLTADIKELDKKLTNLIYEDNDLVVCPRIVQLRENKDRPALKSCNGNETRAKSVQNLKVSDKPRRSDYAVSKIPVFREKKGIRARNDVQCENTPPRNMEKKSIKNKKSDWDNKDTTLYL